MMRTMTQADANSIVFTFPLPPPAPAPSANASTVNTTRALKVRWDETPEVRTRSLSHQCHIRATSVSHQYHAKCHISVNTTRALKVRWDETPEVSRRSRSHQCPTSGKSVSRLRQISVIGLSPLGLGIHERALPVATNATRPPPSPPPLTRPTLWAQRASQGVDVVRLEGAWGHPLSILSISRSILNNLLLLLLNQRAFSGRGRGAA
jgi:hypothetical protein